jgi:hypothetical protein
MTEHFLVKLFEHNNWANSQIIQACSALSDAQLDAEPMSTTKGSIRRTLVHLVNSQHGYLSLLTLPIEARRAISPAFAELQQAASISGAGLLDLARESNNDPRTQLQTTDGYFVEPYWPEVTYVRIASARLGPRARPIRVGRADPRWLEIERLGVHDDFAPARGEDPDERPDGRQVEAGAPEVRLILRRFDGESEAPEVISVTGFVASGGDGDPACGCGAAFGFAQIFAHERVERVQDVVVFVGAEQLQGKRFRNAHGHFIRTAEGQTRVESGGAGEVHGGDFSAIFFLEKFSEAQTEAGVSARAAAVR